MQLVPHWRGEFRGPRCATFRLPGMCDRAPYWGEGGVNAARLGLVLAAHGLPRTWWRWARICDNAGVWTADRGWALVGVLAVIAAGALASLLVSIWTGHVRRLRPWAAWIVVVVVMLAAIQVATQPMSAPGTQGAPSLAPSPAAPSTMMATPVATQTQTAPSEPKPESTPSPGTDAPTVPQSPTSHSPEVERPSQLKRRLAGTWKGQYRCSQGVSGLQLVLWVDSSRVLATFTFYPLDENPSAGSGIFAMKGSYSSNVVKLSGDYWIHNPDGYHMVDLVSHPMESSYRKMLGFVKSPFSGCRNFELTKVSDRSAKPPI